MSDTKTAAAHNPVRREWLGIHKDAQGNTVHVSTVAVTMYAGQPPDFWETKVIGGEHDGFADRHYTKDAAEKGHAACCAWFSPEAIKVSRRFSCLRDEGRASYDDLISSLMEAESARDALADFVRSIELRADIPNEVSRKGSQILERWGLSSALTRSAD